MSLICWVQLLQDTEECATTVPVSEYEVQFTLYHRLPTFYDRGPQQLLWASLQVARGKITVSVVPKRLNYFVTFRVYWSADDRRPWQATDTNLLSYRVKLGTRTVKAHSLCVVTVEILRPR
jgi:hypothetical protein